MVTGLWHGASINFILWGLYFGIILLVEKYVLRSILQKIPTFMSHVYCLFIVLFGWLIFYFVDLGELSLFTQRFFGVGGFWHDYRAVELLLANLWIIPIFAIFSTRAPMRILEYVKYRLPISEPILNFGILAVSFMLLIGQTFNPFIYFRF